MTSSFLARWQGRSRRALLALGLFMGSVAAPLGAAPPEPLQFPPPSKQGDPLQHLPPHIRQLTSFGERPVFSPDSKRVAFVNRMFGDAFEYDLTTGRTRNLTAHTPHDGFLRVHYLADGSYLLLGARPLPKALAQDARLIRRNAIELWVLDKEASGPVMPLQQRLFEGVAVSRKSNRIAWVSLLPNPAPFVRKGTEIVSDASPDQYSVMHTGDVVVRDGVPRVENIKEVLRKGFDDCLLEPQDFRDDDREIISSCYARKNGGLHGNGVWGVRTDSGKMTLYRNVPGEHLEVEGIAPSGAWTAVECGPVAKDTFPREVCRLELVPNGKLTRLTNVLDYEIAKFSNPSISPDGKLMAFHYGWGRGEGEPGAGRGILLMQLPAEHR